MRREFRMPDVGEGLTEAEVVNWHVAPGDTVAVNQIIVEIETAKAAVELPCPYAGTVGELLAEPGQTIEVGTPILAIETGEAAAAAGPEAGAKIGEAGADGRIATLVGYGPRQGTASRRPRRTAPAPGATGPGATAPPTRADQRPGAASRADRGSVLPTADHPTRQAAAAPADAAPGADVAAPVDVTAPAAAAQSAATPQAADRGGGAVWDAGLVPLAKPPVRKLARDLGLDLRAIPGTGPDGVITRDDVQAFAAGASAAPAAAPTAPGVPAAPGVLAAPGAPTVPGAPVVPGAVLPPGAPAPSAGAEPVAPGVRREPIRGVRKATAAAMVSSAFTAPHVTEFLSVDVTATMALRDRLRGSRAFAGVKLTPLAFVAKAVCLAARRTPEVNASWDEAAGEIVYYDRVQLGIAAATPRGLVVPKIRDADTLDLRGLAAALGELTETARAGKTAPADLIGGTFTITNVGVFGVDTGTPIINPGEAAILAVGAIKPTPWVVDGELAVRTVCQLALSFDHRLVDGEQGSRFLADVGALLEDPGIALTW